MIVRLNQIVTGLVWKHTSEFIPFNQSLIGSQNEYIVGGLRSHSRPCCGISAACATVLTKQCGTYL